jgi:hypothetical protein
MLLMLGVHRRMAALVVLMALVALMVLLMAALMVLLVAALPMLLRRITAGVVGLARLAAVALTAVALLAALVVTAVALATMTLATMALATMALVVAVTLVRLGLLLGRVILAAAVHRTGDERREITVDVVVELLDLAVGAMLAAPAVLAPMLAARLALITAATALAHAAALARHAPAPVAAAPRAAIHAPAALLIRETAATAMTLRLGLATVAPAVAALEIGTRLGRATRLISLIGHMSSLFRCRLARQAGLLEGATRGRVSA